MDISNMDFEQFNDKTVEVTFNDGDALVGQYDVLLLAKGNGYDLLSIRTDKGLIGIEPKDISGIKII